MDGVWIALYIAEINPKVDGGKGISNLENEQGQNYSRGQ
jgi:hypothetical protein